MQLFANSKVGFAFGTALSMVGLASSAGAATVVFDAFDNASTGGLTAFTGATPDTNVPGGTWEVQGFGFTAQADATSGFGNTSLYGSATLVDHAFINGDRATIILDGSNSGTLTISSYIKTSSGGGSGLGFSPGAAPTGSGYQFYGLTLLSDGSILGTANGTSLGTVTYTGPEFDISVAYLLSYDVNIATGTVSNISLSGSTADYSGLATALGPYLTTANTKYAALPSNVAGSYAQFTVAAVPEPTTFAALSLLGAFAARRRR